MGHFSKVRALMERANICQRHYYYRTTAQRWRVFHSWDADALVKQPSKDKALSSVSTMATALVNTHDSTKVEVRGLRP